ncbi:hypothetical protein K2X30_05835 [bacterium]|jgi:hypothetical protein|nr:hypothetical protein [bacterium]
MPIINMADQSLDQALSEGKITAFVASFHENERPLHGIAGLLDWRFQGTISNCLKSGAISGKAGESVYIPVQRGKKVFHLFLVGGGYLPDDGSRGKITDQNWTAVSKNLQSLKVTQIGISKTDFAKISDEKLQKLLGDIELWTFQ